MIITSVGSTGSTGSIENFRNGNLFRYSRYFENSKGILKANVKVMNTAAAYYIICLALKIPYGILKVEVMNEVHYRSR